MTVDFSQRLHVATLVPSRHHDPSLPDRYVTLANCELLKPVLRLIKNTRTDVTFIPALHINTIVHTATTFHTIMYFSSCNTSIAEGEGL